MNVACNQHLGLKPRSSGCESSTLTARTRVFSILYTFTQRYNFHFDLEDEMSGC